MGVGVFVSASFFNHDCCPNCFVSFDARGNLEARALVDSGPELPDEPGSDEGGEPLSKL